MSKTKSYFGVVICAFIASLFVSGLYNNIVFAASASISTTGTVSIDVSAAGNSANVATDNVVVSSPCPLGYTLSIKGPTDTTLYKVNEQTGLADKANSSTSSKIIPTMGTKTAPLPIIGEDGSGNSYLGTWGYSMTNNLATGTFIGLTNTITELATKTSASGDGTTTTDTIPVYYGVSVRPDIEAGTYKLAESTTGANDNVISYFLTTPIGCNQYNIVYNGNSATSGSTASSIATYDASHTFTNNGFSRTGYTFQGWSTDSNATTATYTNGQTLTAEQVNSLVSGLNDGGTRTLYAVWKINTYTIKYNGNSSTSGSTASSTATYNTAHTLTANGFARTGYTFLGWSTSSTATSATYTNSQALTAAQVNALVGNNANGATINLYAVWKINTYNIAYNGNNATSGSTAATTATYNTAHTLRANGFSRTGYTFQGWSTSSTATSATYTNSQALTAAQVNTLVGSNASGATINLYAVWKANTYTIRYNSNQTGQTTYNTAQTVSGSTANTTATYNAAHTLRANGFTRLGFRFLGWSTSSTATSATYTNSQALTAAQLNSLVGSTANGGTINLYAIWQPKSSLNSITNMQQMTTAICNDTYTPTKATTTANTNQYFSANNIPQRTLTDTRDNNTYTVRKLADGKCWMTQNLRLVGSRTLTSANSNVSSNFTLPASSTNWGAAANDGVARINNTGNASYGVYYNWFAATAGTGTTTMASGNATSSVCPKGWRLPANTEPQTLYNTYGNANSFISATSALLLGHWNNSSALYQGSNGYWWSRTANNVTNAYFFSFTSSSTGFQGSYHKGYGLSIRCITE